MSDFMVNIQTRGPLEGFPRVWFVALETVSSPQYYWAGRDRPLPEYCFFQYTLSGEGRFCDGKDEYAVKPGMGFLCESNDPATAYYYPKSTQGTPWVFMFVNFSGEVARVMVESMVGRYGYVYSLAPSHSAIRALMSFQTHDHLTYTVMASESCRLVTDLLQALSSSAEESQVERLEHQLIQRAQKTVQQGLHINQNATDLARQLGVSREHLTRTFKTQLGVSPYQYILRQKMMLACNLLKNTDLQVCEIALRLGFDEPSHFTRTFKRIIRQNPNQFRQLGIIPVL